MNGMSSLLKFVVTNFLTDCSILQELPLLIKPVSGLLNSFNIQIGIGKQKEGLNNYLDNIGTISSLELYCIYINKCAFNLMCIGLLLSRYG